MSEVVLCAECGFSITPAEIMCPQCGMPLRKMSVAAPKAEPRDAYIPPSQAPRRNATVNEVAELGKNAFMAGCSLFIGIPLFLLAIGLIVFIFSSVGH